MREFWIFARRMLRYRALLVLAMLFAALSAGGLGVGLLGMLPVLRVIFPSDQSPPQELPELVTGLSRRVEAAIGVGVPPGWIAELPRGPFTAVVVVVVVLGLLTILGAAANFLHAYCSLTIVARTIAELRRDVFRRAVHLPLKTVVTAGPSDVVSRIVYDTATLGAGFNALLSKAVAQASKGLVAALVALYLDWRLALTGLVVAPLVAVVLRKIGKRIRRASRSALESQAGLYHAASEVLSGLRVVKVHANERAEAGRFHKINKQVVKQEFRVRTARALASPLVETLALFVLGGLALVAAKAIIDGKLDPTRFLLVFGALGTAAASLKPLTGIWNDMHQSSAAADRLGQLLGYDLEPGHGHRLARLPRHERSIMFQKVVFTYAGAEQPALRDVSLAIPHGETVAFVGPNGCGKTTLLSLIPRLFDPDAGRVLIDGRDVREFNVRSVRRQVGVVTQETVLFRGSIRDNIAYGLWGVSDARVRVAARRARAEEFILKKPGGYDFEIGEGGSGLSGGQRQRLAIARAILRDPAILILDEATSMIDAESEAKIAEAIAEFVSAGRADKAGDSGNGAARHNGRGADGSGRPQGRTCLIVAHRLSTVVAADRIVVMDAGRIVDQGTHAELLGRCRLYRTLVQNQLVRMPERGADGAGGGKTEAASPGDGESGRDGVAERAP